MSAEDNSTMITAKAKARAQEALSYSQRQLDRVVSPATRNRAIESGATFASQRPLLSFFIGIQLIFALIPFLFFLNFLIITITIATFFTVAFELFMISLALFFLMPTLFLTFGAGVFVWMWATGAYIGGRAVYERLPVSIRGNMHMRMPGGKQVIFHKPSPDGDHPGLEAAIKAEADEVRE